jgi:anti-sigma factor RsiW
MVMSCETWTEKLDAYFDGELLPDEARALNDHLRQCATCAAEGLSRVQQKRAVQAAAQRFTPDPAFRARIQKKIASPKPILWRRRWFPALATVTASVLIAGFLIAFQHNRRSDQQLFSELVDQHVSTLASANPVDVISSDRHTVRPWFEGKIPFTFNLPELQGSPFVLVGGRVSYLGQSPGAELIFRVRQHQISLFIFQEQGLRNAGESESLRTTLSFQVRTWRCNGLRYFAIGDVNGEDLDQLSELIRAAG